MHVVSSRKEAVRTLTAEPDRIISGYYADTEEQAARIAWRVAFLLQKATGTPPTTASLRQHYEAVLRDDPYISEIINTYGYGHYRRA